MNPARKILHRLGCALAAIALAFAWAGALAYSDAPVDILSREGGAGLGIGTRVEQSPYRGVGARFDFLPLYLFEGDIVYLHGYRLGAKRDLSPGNRVDLFLSHRFEGFPYDRVPATLSGMNGRDPGFDFGAGFRHRVPWGSLWGELLYDISGVSRGTEARFGLHIDWQSGRTRLQPTLAVSLRDRALNEYYYGVLPAEAAPDRPEYSPGAGVNGQIGLNARYDIDRRWRLVAGVSLTRWSPGVRKSPITDVPIGQASGFLGIAYDFTPQERDWKERGPLIWKVLVGRSTDCNLVPVLRLTCTSIDTDDKTRIAALEVGRPLLREVNGWPLDFVGYLGVLRHDERGLQSDGWEVNGYIKAFFYGFPWRQRVRTRVGFGVGASYAQKVPFVEQRDQQRRGRNASKLLNYLDPSLDINLGDLTGRRSLREAYFGFGASHRSGIFGNSQLLGNVDGGSNYLYTYVEWRM